MIKKNIVIALMLYMILVSCRNASFVIPAETSLPTATGQSSASLNKPASPEPATAQTKIKHIVVIMQENRSFDHYFGTFPGANGIPMQNGVPTVCVNDPATKQCVKPYHDPNDINYGAAHGAPAAMAAIHNGKMNGFLLVLRGSPRGCADPYDPLCVNGSGIPDVMGWHDAREIPNYWAYAKNFVLQDHMFEPVASWSLPDHLYMVSAWSARCSNSLNPLSCISDISNIGRGY